MQCMKWLLFVLGLILLSLNQWELASIRISIHTIKPYEICQQPGSPVMVSALYLPLPILSGNLGRGDSLGVETW